MTCADNRIDGSLRNGLLRIERRRKRCWLIVVSLLAYLLGAVVLLFVLRSISHTLASWLFGGWAILVTLFFLSYGAYSLSTCPRCHKLCFVKFFYSNPFSSRCLHCSLRLDVRELRGYCAGCGYDLRANPGPRCPECGRPFETQ